MDLFDASLVKVEPSHEKALQNEKALPALEHMQHAADQPGQSLVPNKLEAAKTDEENEEGEEEEIPPAQDFVPQGMNSEEQLQLQYAQEVDLALEDAAADVEKEDSDSGDLRRQQPTMRATESKKRAEEKEAKRKLVLQKLKLKKVQRGERKRSRLQMLQMLLLPHLPKVLRHPLHLLPRKAKGKKWQSLMKIRVTLTWPRPSLSKRKRKEGAGGQEGTGASST